MSIRRSVISTTATALLLLATAPLLAVRGNDADRKSKNGQATGDVAGVHVTVDYGRPLVGGRELWGALVPYDKVWRTGADEATTITFDKNVTIEGKALAAGTYALFTIPGRDRWTVIFNRTAQQWGAFKYDATQDALRVEVTPAKHDPVDALTFEVRGSEVVMTWGTVAVAFRVGAGG